MTTARSAGLGACLAVGLAGVAFGQAAEQEKIAQRYVIQSDGHSRIIDPKLAGGGAEASFHLAPSIPSLAAVAEVYGPGGLVKSVWSGTLTGGAASTVVAWDGTDAGGNYVDTGDYTLVVRAASGLGAGLGLPISVVRLGITEIEFQDSAAGNDEWQMVYFKKGGSDGVFYATPAIHEYFNTKSTGEVSDLDLNDGSPRPAVALHTTTDQPVMDGANYETERYNYPAAYIAGSSPRLEVTFGDSATSSAGAAMDCGYPVAGYDLRLVAELPVGVTATSGPIAPGGAVTIDGGVLPNDVGRYPLAATWRWEYAESGSDAWQPVAGSTSTSHRVYTMIGAPNFKAGASGTQYAGPWVELIDYVASWKNTLGVDTSTQGGVVEAFVKGFVGQNGGIPTAIEGVLYDAYPLGGDGGATHYFQSFGSNMDLSALLNGHAKGIYVNCTDNMGATTTGLSMLGVDGVRPVRLGPMTLKAIWGIGAPEYTTNLWGTAHSFSYHHIVTRTNGVEVIDTCMQLDEDGDPGATPGIPGWNVDRPWSGIGGYDDLSSYNAVSTTLESLPGLL